MGSHQASVKALSGAVVKLLRPLVRILIRYGISYGTFADLSKWLFVDVVKKECVIKGRKQSISRVAVITGLSRKEVKRLFELPAPDVHIGVEQYNRGVRVISGWLQETAFLNRKGKPAVLPICGQGATFYDLVRRFSGDMPVRAVLDELIHTGMVHRLPNDQVRLIRSAYIPQGDDLMKLHVLGSDVGRLIATIDHNLQNSSASYFHRNVSYDNLPNDILPQFRKRSSSSAGRVLTQLNKWLARHDRDVNPQVRGVGRNMAGMTIFYFEKPVEDDTYD